MSIGVLICVTAPESADALIRRADDLMYAVRRAAKDGVLCGTRELPPQPPTRVPAAETPPAPVVAKRLL